MPGLQAAEQFFGKARRNKNCFEVKGLQEWRQLIAESGGKRR